MTAAEPLGREYSTPTEAFERLAELTGAYWQGVDARQFVRSLRYEDDDDVDNEGDDTAEHQGDL